MYKRTLAFVLTLCMILAMFPVAALAAETTDAGSFQMTYINPLYADVITEEDLNKSSESVSTYSVVKGDTEYSTSIEEAGEYMRKRMVNRHDTISVCYATDSFDGSEAAAQQLMKGIFFEAVSHTGVGTQGDYLLWQFAGWNCTGGAEVSAGTYYIELTYTLTYYTDDFQEEEVTEAVAALLEELVVSGMTDYQKVKAAYDWICANVTYDNANLNDDSYTLKYTAYAALVNKTAVCQGYALLLYRLALEMGIDCRLIPGTSSGGAHGWNIVELSDKYYNADSTWDAGETEYSWFLLSEESFTGHTRDGASDFYSEDYTSDEFYKAYPMSDTDYAPTEEDLTIPDDGDDDNTEPDNRCGENAVWTLENGVLTISGTGAMTDYEDVSDTPWFESRDSITSVVIEEGITHVGSSVFIKYGNLTSFETASSVATIGDFALSECSALTDVTLAEGLTKLNQMVFYNCTALKEITFPTTLTTIDFMAMSGCSALREIYFRGDAPSFISSENFDSVTATAYYPAGNSTWTSDVMYDYNGTLTWVAYCPDGCTYETVVKEATCTEPGGTTHTCTVCGASFVENETPALGHTFVDGICSVCGQEEIELQSPVVTVSNIESTGKIKLTWDAVEGADHYVVYYSTNKYDINSYTVLKEVSGTSLKHTSAKAGTTYYYCVTSVSRAGTESECPEEYIVTGICKLARPTVTLGNKASTGKVTISWDAVEGAVSYKVYRALSENGKYSVIKTTDKTSLTNTKTEAGVTYYYKVRAIAEDTAANSYVSGAKARTCDLPCPELTLSNVASTGKVRITWTAVDGAVQYKLYRATSKDGDYELIKTTEATAVTNTRTDAGVTYYYKVRALSDVDSAHSAYSAIKSRACDLKQPVIRLTNVASTGKIRISWDRVDGAVSYKVYRAASKDGEYELIKTTSATSVTNTKTEAGETYYYKVRAIAADSAANSAYSAVASRVCKLPRPEVSITLNNAGKPDLYWDDVRGAVGYEVYQYVEADDAFVLLSTVTEPGYVHKAAKTGQTYSYAVVALAPDASWNSARSEQVFIPCVSVDITDSETVKAVVSRINEYREYYGLEALEWYDEGVNAARIRAAEMYEGVSRTEAKHEELLMMYGLYVELNLQGSVTATELVDAIMTYEELEDMAGACMYEEFTYAVAVRNSDCWVIMLGGEGL